MKTFVAFALGFFAAAVSPPGCDSSYKRVTVVKMASIYTPDNLSSDPDCQGWWSNIARAGIDMDDFGKDWNDTVLDSATFLIENGCVHRAKGQ